MRSLEIDHLVTIENFDEDAYLASNPDVAQVVAAGGLQSGRLHFERHGMKERRRARLTAGVPGLRRYEIATTPPIAAVAFAACQTW